MGVLLLVVKVVAFDLCRVMLLDSVSDIHW
jgi:hypothetical protein